MESEKKDTTHTYENFRLKRMAQQVQSATTVIDIGYADNPNPFLFNHEVIGIDLRMTDIPNNYSKVIQSDYRDADRHLKGINVEAIIAAEIIEHLEDPMGFLRTCHSLLCKNGKIVLSTPNPNSPIERLLTLTLNRRYFYTQDHIMLFPQRWLIRMIEKVGFRNVELYSGGFPLPFLGLIPCPRPWCYQTIAVASK